MTHVHEGLWCRPCVEHGFDAARATPVDGLREALQQDANLIHYGRYTKNPAAHSERFEDCVHPRCVGRRELLATDNPARKPER